MRWLVPLLLVGTSWCVEPAPLRDRAVDRAQVLPALMGLSRGDAAAFLALPAEVFLADAGVPDPSDPDLIRRWTSAVPAALARMPDQARDTVLIALEQRCQLLIRDARSEEDRNRIAAAFLPAPSAVARLASEADRAFDRGAFRTFLSLSSLIERTDQRRNEVALALLGTGAAIDSSLALQPPGTPIPTTGAAASPAHGLGVHWQMAPGWLLACDAWGGVLWQYRLVDQAVTVLGDGGALIRDDRGLRLVDERGRVTPLPPAPSSARALAIAGGAAWFANGPTVHRLDLANLRLTSVTLPEDALAPPLVRGESSLWLTARELVLVESGRMTHRLEHGLPAGAGWTLDADGASPLIRSESGATWQVGQLTQQLAQADPPARLQLLVRAGRMREAVELFDAEPALAQDPSSRRAALRAHLAQDVAHRRSHVDAMLRIADTPQDRATTLLACEQLDALADECRSHPQVLLPLGDFTWAADPDSWNHVLAGRAWIDRQPRLDWLTVAPEQRAAIDLDGVRSAVERIAPARQPDGRWTVDGWTVRCDASMAGIIVTCHDGQGLRWRHRWEALDPLLAPGRSVAVRDGWIVVVEGAARVRILDLDDGRLATDVSLTGRDVVATSIIPLGPHRIADLGPLGVDSKATIQGEGDPQVFTLPGPARWLLPWNDGFLAVLRDGRAFAYPDESPVSLPAPLIGADPPAITRTGLEANGHCWPWRN